MRTNINLDDKLVKEAFNYISVSTKKELINIALKEFVETHKRLNPEEIKGKIKFEKDYDYKKLRAGR
jgi:Arc/MetJ family transcription regulator